MKSPPYNPQSNGLTKRTVQSVKKVKLLNKNTDLYFSWCASWGKFI